MNKKGKYKSPWQATVNGITDLYRKKSASVALPNSVDLSGKTVMITGSSSGLGLAASKRIADAGAKVVMAVRSGIPEKGEEVKRHSGNPEVRMFHVDLLDFVSINNLLVKLEQENITIDILISNAAMVPLKSRRSPQGLEEMFMVNYLAPFYLINEMIGREILHSEKSRIIIVSSESHRNADVFEWEKFGKYEACGMNETVTRYGYYKLFLTTFAKELSRRLVEAQEQMPVRVLCPGPVNSNIAREAPGWMQPLLKLVFSIFFKSPGKASDPIMYFVSESNAEHRPIDYLFLMQPKEMDEKAREETNGRKLWDLSQELIEDIFSKYKIQNK